MSSLRQQNAIVKFSFVVAPIIYIVMAGLVSQQAVEGSAPDPQMVANLSTVLCIVYAVTVLLTPVIAGQVLRQQGVYNKSVMIVKLALFESGAIYGLMLSLLTHDIQWAGGFGMVAALLILFQVKVPDQ